MTATEYELTDIDLLEEIRKSGQHSVSPVFAVESDDIGEVVSAVERLEYFASVDDPDSAGGIAQVIDAIEEHRDVPRLMATARRDGVVRFIVVPVGARWWIHHLTGIPENDVRWAIL